MTQEEVLGTPKRIEDALAQYQVESIASTDATTAGTAAVSHDDDDFEQLTPKTKTQQERTTSTLQAALASPVNASAVPASTPAKRQAEGVALRKKLETLYRTHWELISDIQRFDKAHQGPVERSDLSERFACIRRWNNNLKTQQKEIGKVLESLRGHLTPKTRENFVRELNERTRRMEVILEACSERIYPSKAPGKIR